MSLRIGDKVVYPMYGAGEIISTECKEVYGETRRYFNLKLPYSKLVLLIPEDSADAVGIRQPVPAEEIPDVIKALTKTYCYESSCWSKRQKENSDKLKKGDIYSVAEVYAVLSARDNSHNISSGEKRLKTAATNILYSEIAASLGIDFLEVEKYIRDELDKIGTDDKR